jgi:hypothetical protein
MSALRLGSLALSAAALCACTSTRMVTSWRDPESARVAFKKVLVVAIVKDLDRRRAVESRMVADIARPGVVAVPSFKLITAADTRNDATLKAAMQEGGFDGAVVWRTISIKTETHVVEGGRPTLMMNPGFWGYYDLGWRVETDPPTLTTERVVSVETTVYRITRDSDQLVWTGTSDTIDPSSLDKLVDGVVDATLSSMRHDGLFGKD